MERVDRAAEKLARLKKSDAERKVFGAAFHKYTLNPTLTEETVVTFEREHGVRLPEEYRLYLLRVANGGAGPFYGLLALEDNDDITVHMSAPFPLTADRPFVMPELYEEIGARAGGMDEAEEFRERMLEEHFTKVNSGVTYLAHEGCGMYSVLAVKGAEYGNVWYVDLANDAGAFPLVDPKSGKSLDFLSWFELWLDAALSMMEEGGRELEGYSYFIPESAAARL
ncbi:MAG: SMI1/KNR4 family protein [Synergistaceae bacterium]|jgi:hypothetical protein|nr:SMI1/KNR4 family protein [Synergistaceae bacterium]